MSEEERREMQKRLEDLDRLRRYEEAGWESEPRVPLEEERRVYGGRRELTEEEMRRSGADRTEYPAGTGSYYSETFVKPTGRASPESYWNEPREERPVARRKELTEEEMRRSGSDRTEYPAGTGSYYSETFVKPTGRASPESYWNEPFRDREPPERRVKAAPETHRKRTERHHPVKKTRVVKHAEAPPRPVAMRQEKVHRELVYEPPRESAYRESIDRPIHRASPFDVRARGPEYETIRYTETAPERFVERYEIGPDGKERLLSSRRIEVPESVPARIAPAERYGEPERRTEARGIFTDEREWVDPRDAGRLRGKAQAALGRRTEGAQRYGGEAVTRSRDLGQQITERGREAGSRAGEWGKGAGSRIGEWGREASDRAREAAAGREFEDSAYRAGSALGSAIRKVTSVSRELSSGFREGMGDEYPEGSWEESRARAREKFREEEARYHEGSLERRRPPHSHEEWASEEEEAPSRSVDIKGPTREVYGEVKERTPSKKISSAPSKAKRTASTAKRKVEKNVEELEEDW